MLKKLSIIIILLSFLIGVGCSSNKMKYNKPRNGGKRVVANGNMRR